MSWSGVITDVGAELLAKYAQGSTLTVTKAEIGTVYIGNKEQLKALTSLSGVKDSVRVGQYKTITGGVRVPAVFKTIGIEYTAHEIGLWAKVGDNDDTLLAVYEEETGQVFPENQSDFAFKIWCPLLLNPSENFSVTINPSAYVDIETLEDYATITYVDGKVTELTNSLMSNSTPRAFADMKIKGTAYINWDGEESTSGDAVASQSWVNAQGFITAHQDISGKEDKSNRVTTVSSLSDDEHYPTAKAVYDAVNGSAPAGAEKQSNKVTYEQIKEGTKQWGTNLTDIEYLSAKLSYEQIEELRQTVYGFKDSAEQTSNKRNDFTILPTELKTLKDNYEAEHGAGSWTEEVEATEISAFEQDCYPTLMGLQTIVSKEMGPTETQIEEYKTNYETAWGTGSFDDAAKEKYITAYKLYCAPNVTTVEDELTSTRATILEQVALLNNALSKVIDKVVEINTTLTNFGTKSETVSESSTHDTFPSSKAVYDFVKSYVDSKIK